MVGEILFPTFNFLLLFFSLVIGMSNAMDELYASKKHRADDLRLGAIIDYSSRAGKEEKVAMTMAVEDFCKFFSNRPTLSFKNYGGDPVQAASSAKTLVKKHHVRVIVGLGTWEEAKFAADLANKSEVPILPLANDVPSWAFSHWPFLLNAARSQFAQMEAVAATIRTWKWRKVNIIYEDIESAVTGIIPYLIEALKEVESDINELVPLSPLPDQYNSLSEKLKNLKNGQCRVFIVHTSVTLATNIFQQAKNLGMMEKEFVWITTNSISDAIDTLNASVITSMQGVLGVKSYFLHSGKEFQDFRFRFRNIFTRKYPNETHAEPGIFALQAYDAVRAVALAVEGNSDRKTNFPNSLDVAHISGQKLLNRILESNFEGLTGAFNFDQGKLATAQNYRIVNVVGKSYRELGYWSKGFGFSVRISEGSTFDESMRILGQVLWPGGPWSIPRGWAAATSAKPLKIGVPMGKMHAEFVNVRYEHPGSRPNVTGFSVDVFKAIVDLLPYSLQYEFVPFQGTYDSLTYQVHLEKFDAVVGDTAIVSNRSKYGEFSQPYADPGLQMLVRVKPRRSERAWLFKKPFTTLMWAATGATVLYNGFVVWLIERKHNPEFTRGTKLNQAGTMVSLAFTTLFSLQGEKLNSNLSRMTMVVWLFVALVITQSYTASLTSLLTVRRLDPTTIDIETLKRTGAKVGCDGNSFVVKYLEVVLGFHPKNIKKIYLDDDYPQALIRGDIAAAFLEVPYVKVFLAKNCNGFTTGPIFKVGGFGFVFPRGSPYLPEISRAVLEISESGKLRELESSMMSSFKCSVSKSEEDLDSLGLPSFGGLFSITVGTTTIALVLFLIRYVYQKQWCCWHYYYDVPHQQPNNHADHEHGLPHQPYASEHWDWLLPQRHAHEHWLSAWEMENQGRCAQV